MAAEKAPDPNCDLLLQALIKGSGLLSTSPNRHVRQANQVGTRSSTSLARLQSTSFSHQDQQVAVKPDARAQLPDISAFQHVVRGRSPIPGLRQVDVDEADEKTVRPSSSRIPLSIEDKLSAGQQRNNSSNTWDLSPASASDAADNQHHDAPQLTSAWQSLVAQSDSYDR